MPVPLPKIKKVSVDLSPGVQPNENGTRKRGRRGKLSLKNQSGGGVKKSEIMRKIREGLLERRKGGRRLTKKREKTDDEPKSSVQNAIDFFESKGKKSGGLGDIIKADSSYEVPKQSSIELQFPSLATTSTVTYKPSKPLKSILKRRNEPAEVPSSESPSSSQSDINDNVQPETVEYEPPKFITPKFITGEESPEMISGGSKKRRARRRATRIERKRTYKLGKKGRKVSVMIYGNKTRKRLKDEHNSYKSGDTSKMRRVLRHRCLMKAGSTAPPGLVREMYSQIRMVGDVLAGGKNANDLQEYYDLNN